MTLQNWAGAWAALATEQLELDGVLAVHNPDLPVLQANAIYDFSSSPTQLTQARMWLESRSNVVSVYSSLDGLELIEPKMLELQYSVEQVNWTQARALARVWCNAHDPSWEPFVTRALTRAMQNEPRLTAFLAFDSSQAVDMLLAFDNMVLLEAGHEKLELRNALLTMLDSSVWAIKNPQ
jgi:hypothetical protein